MAALVTQVTRERDRRGARALDSSPDARDPLTPRRDLLDGADRSDRFRDHHADPADVRPALRGAGDRVRRPGVRLFGDAGPRDGPAGPALRPGPPPADDSPGDAFDRR